MTEPLRPRALAPGDRVAIVAPSHAVVPERLDAGLRTLRGWGLVPVELPHARDRHGHLAGSDDARLDDLQHALDDPDLRAVWVARGGSGLGRIVDRLDWTRMGADPKPIIGFSDATTLLHAAWRQLRLVTVHGQFAGRAHLVDRHPDAAGHLLDLLHGRLGPGSRMRLPGGPEPVTVVGGTAEGRLLGGNLSVLAAAVGTPWQADLAGAMVVLEEVGEAPYRIDRALTQLRTAGLLDRVAGVLVGGFVACDPPAGAPSATVAEVVEDRLGDLGVPVLAELPIGHVDGNLALPHGARVRLTADTATLELLEPPVI